MGGLPLVHASTLQRAPYRFLTLRRVGAVAPAREVGLGSGHAPRMGEPRVGGAGFVSEEGGKRYWESYLKSTAPAYGCPITRFLQGAQGPLHELEPKPGGRSSTVTGAPATGHQRLAT